MPFSEIKQVSQSMESDMPGAVYMEAETIIYYHPLLEQGDVNCAAKRHWWQDAVLKETPLPRQIPSAEEMKSTFTLVDCPVPPFSYKRRAWKPEELSESMEAVLHRTPGMADTYLHPQIMTYVSEMYAERWETCRKTQELLLASLVTVYAASCLRKQGRVTVLLGAPEDTQWQMEMTWRLLAPYLERINSLLFYYKQVGEADIWEELSAYLETYYYEYGLVAQLVPYQVKEGGEYFVPGKCQGVIMDYGSSAGGLKIEPGGQSIYVDMIFSEKKEQIYARKGGQILYVSPLKYLDTMVKNSYDRLVR